MGDFRSDLPLGTDDPQVFYANVSNLDEAVTTRESETWVDRKGITRQTWYGMEEAFQQFLINSGYENIGDYGSGLNITARNQIFWKDGELYRAGAELELPYTTTGDWLTEESLFVAVGDQALRQELAQPDGAAMVGFIAEPTGSVHRTVLEKLRDFISVKDFGAIGDGITDDTSAFEDALAYEVNNAGTTIYIPAGIYRLTDTLNLHSWSNLQGDGPFNSKLVIDHNGPGIEYIVGDNFPINLNQGGGNSVRGIKIMRAESPPAKVPGNYGLKMPATFATTVIEDVEFQNMGDSSIYYEDVAPTSVGSGPIHFHRIGSAGTWGWIIEMHRLFANVFIDKVTSVRNGGGVYMDASGSNVGFIAANVSIRDCIFETAGLGTGGMTNPAAGPCLELNSINGVQIENNYFSTHEVNTNPAIVLRNTRAVDFSGGNFVVGGNGKGLIALLSDNRTVHIGSSNILEGLEKSVYGIYSRGTTNLTIDNPRLTGWGVGVELDFDASNFYPVKVSTPQGVIFRTSNYGGSIRDLKNASGRQDDHSTVLGALQPKGVANFAYSAGNATLLSSAGVISGVTRTGTGLYTVHLTGETRSLYPVLITMNNAASTAPKVYDYSAQSASQFQIRILSTGTGAPADINSMTVVIF